MNELLSSGLWPRIRQLAKKAKRKSAAVAYVTDDTHIKFGDGDTLVADASDEAIKSGQTSARVLKEAFKRGAQIASITGLHSKIYVFDRCAIIGSANLSKESERRSEAALVTDQPAKGKPNRVYHHAPILLRKDDKETDVSWFYVEEYPDAEDTTITWKRFQKLYSQIGLSGKPSQWATREIASHHSEALHNLWLDG